jgi:putative aldouronate transport system permease protein
MVERLGFQKEFRARTFFVIANTALFVIVATVVIFPIYKILVDSLDLTATSLEFRMWPQTFSLDAYQRIITQPWLFRPFLTSLYTTTVGTVIALFLTTTFAYVLTRRDMPGRNILMYMALLTMVFRGGMIPLFLVVKKLHLYNTLWAIMIPVAINTYYLILLRNFFSSIPKSIIESAEIEGCSPFQVYYMIVLPLSKASLAAIGLFYVVQYWNEFFRYVIYIRERAMWNFQAVLRSLVLESETIQGVTYDIAFESLKNAAIIVIIIPVLILYPILQKYFVKGVNLGAIKE